MFKTITDADVPRVRDFLEANLPTSVFLLSCLDQFGPSLGIHPNSGTYRCCEEDGRIAGVFSLTRRGHLLAQTAGRGHLGEAMLDACADDVVRVSGVLAEWRAAESLARALGRNSGFKPGYTTKNVVYRLDVPRDPPAAPSCVRALAPRDFEQWDALNTAFVTDEGAPLLSSLDVRHAIFVRRATAGWWWGAFDGDELASIAALDESYAKTAQIGGMYTRPSHRRRGFARAVMQGALADCVGRHRLTSFVLFTAEQNTPARALYESLGFSAVGLFGYLFW